METAVEWNDPGLIPVWKLEVFSRPCKFYVMIFTSHRRKRGSTGPLRLRGGKFSFCFVMVPGIILNLTFYHSCTLVYRIDSWLTVERAGYLAVILKLCQSRDSARIEEAIGTHILYVMFVRA